jgi:predicted Fe-Mo cluster-binding NifX family protein
MRDMDPVHRKVAIPRFGETVAPCFEFSATVAIFSITDGKVIGQTDFVLNTQRALDRVRLLRDQEVDTLVCGGVQDRVEDIIRAAGIQVISWVSGSVEELLESLLRGELRRRPSRAGSPDTGAPEPQDEA